MINPEMGSREPEEEIPQQEGIGDESAVSSEKRQHQAEDLEKMERDSVGKAASRLGETREKLKKVYDGDKKEVIQEKDSKEAKYQDSRIAELGEQFFEIENNPDKSFLSVIKNVFTGKTFKYGPDNLQKGLLSEKVDPETLDAVVEYSRRKRLEEAERYIADHQGEKISIWRMFKKTFTKDKK